MTEAELLFTEILNCNRQDLYLNKEAFLDKAAASLISSALKRRVQGEPLQYILGKTEFMGLEFKVTPEVFIPRPETEILVETAIKSVHSPLCPAVHSILDVGTGSGCIAISLAKFLKNARVNAIDISNAALKVARQNAQLNNVEINFIQSDLFNTVNSRLSAVDLIVTNPPYVPTREIGKLQPEIRYEPAIALDGGKDGLDFYRRIIQEAPRFLREGGFLIMEMGFNQAEAIKNIFQKSGVFEIIELIKDYNNIERAIVAKKAKGIWKN